MLGFQPNKQGRQELPGLIFQSMHNKILVLKLYYAGIPTQQARETGAPWTDISVYDNKILVLKLYYAGIPTQQARETGAPWTYISVYDIWYFSTETM